jgi:hypothetical protein
MEPLRFMFGKQNGVTPFFVWLESELEQNHSILCLVGEHASAVTSSFLG